MQPSMQLPMLLPPMLYTNTQSSYQALALGSAGFAAILETGFAAVLGRAAGIHAAASKGAICSF